MGLSSMPAPSDGVLCVILMNTALSIAIVKKVFRTILDLFGIRPSISSSPDDDGDGDADSASGAEIDPTERQARRTAPSMSYVEGFRSRTTAARFDSLAVACRRRDQECCVCLNRFCPESEINRLHCGHVFHRACVERWLDYWNVTCPLCRTPFVPAAAEDDAASAAAYVE